MNSLKMKMSVILGVSHMAAGVTLRIANAFHFRSAVDFWFESLPMLVFLLALFGYMIFLIFYKWCLPNGDVAIITTMISMALAGGVVTVTVTPIALDSSDAGRLSCVTAVAAADASLCTSLSSSSR